MKKILLAILLTFTTLSATDLNSDFWSARDKQQHAAIGAFIGIGASALALQNGSSKLEAFLIATGTVLTVAMAKEFLDGKNPLTHTEDIGDAYATGVSGMGAAALTVMLVDIKF